ncbi:hypothetical protein M0804_004236 [Polistes exclamans]|nr:hypothetical protein M0804_004236 [Polistes exclamans]
MCSEGTDKQDVGPKADVSAHATGLRALLKISKAHRSSIENDFVRARVGILSISNVGGSDDDDDDDDDDDNDNDNNNNNNKSTIFILNFVLKYIFLSYIYIELCTLNSRRVEFS